MEVQLSMVLIAVGCLLAVGGLSVWIVLRKKTAYLGPVKEELRKEKSWLRRNEYNAAMVKGRQNLELLLKLVAEKHGIQLDNTAKAVADAKEMEERASQRGRRKRTESSVMTYKQFNRWMVDNGYLDRVARWEMNQVRLIGNKAVHENYADKEDAWSQYEYLEDILKTIAEEGQSHTKRQERRKEVEEKMVAAAPVKAYKQKKRKPKPKQDQRPQTEKEYRPKQNQQPILIETAEQKKPHRRRRRRKKPQNNHKKCAGGQA